VFGRKARAIAESLEGVPRRVMANLYLAGAYLSVLKVLQKSLKEGGSHGRPVIVNVTDSMRNAP